MNTITSLTTLLEALEHLMIEKSTVMVTLIGSGGKTTTLFKLMDYFNKEKRVLVSSTTAMKHPNDRLQRIVYEENELGTKRLLIVEPIGYFKRYDSENNKVIGVPPEELDRVYQKKEFDLILVEGDGSKGKPLKGFAPYEPVIPKESDVVLILVGTDGLNQPLSEEIVHRSDLFQQEASMKFNEKITLMHILKVLSVTHGPLDKIPSKAKRILVLNKIESYGNIQDRTEVLALQNIVQDLGFDAMILTEMQP